MSSPRLIGHALAALVTLVIAVIAVGCAKNPQSSTSINPRTNIKDAPTSDITAAPADDSVQRSQARGEGAGAAGSDAPFNAPEALKRKAAEYSQQVDSMIGSGAPASATAPSVASPRPQVAQRQPGEFSRQPGEFSRQPGAFPRQPSAFPQQPSQVQWGDPTAAGREAANTHRAPANGEADTVAAEPGMNPADVKRVSSWSNTPVTTADKQPGWVPPGTASPGSAGTGAGAATGGGASAGSADAMSQKIEKRVREYPRDISGHLDFQLLRFLQDERVPELNTISALPNEDRELVAAVVDGLSNFRNGLRQDNNMLLSRKIRPLLEMADRLRGDADLAIPTIALCTKVRTFGDYDPINPPRFAANRAHEVILYCEIDNFSSQLDEHQMWITKLAKDAVLYTENGIPVWSDRSETITDTARRRRHDFFFVKKLRLPDNLAVGRYLMKVSIHDQQVNRVAEATLPIIVAAE